jgi:hypothetical protein
MLDRIAKRAKRLKELKARTAKKASYAKHFFTFLKEMEKMYGFHKDPVDFDRMLTANCKMLDEQFKLVDPHVKLEILWNDAQSWQDLRATGLKITWSNIFLNANPGKDLVEYIDITQALLEDVGVLDEQEETKTE